MTEAIVVALITAGLPTLATAITVGTDTQLSTGSYSYDYASAVALGTDKVFIAHRNGNYLYGVVATAPDITVQSATSQSTVAALTKTACTNTTAGDVWILRI